VAWLLRPLSAPSEMEHAPTQIAAMVAASDRAEPVRYCSTLRVLGLKMGCVILSDRNCARRNAALGKQDASPEKRKSRKAQRPSCFLIFALGGEIVPANGPSFLARAVTQCYQQLGLQPPPLDLLLLWLFELFELLHFLLFLLLVLHFTVFGLPPQPPVTTAGALMASAAN